MISTAAARHRVKCLIGADPDQGPDPITWEIVGIPTADVVDAFAFLRRMYSGDAKMPPYQLVLQPDGAPSLPSIRAITAYARIEMNVPGSSPVATTRRPKKGNPATLTARWAQTLTGRDMVVDALLRWLVPFHSQLPRLLVDIDPADVAGMIPPGGARLTLYNIQGASLDLLEQRVHESIGTTTLHKVAGSCSLLAAPESLSIGPLLRLLSSNARCLSLDAKHVYGILRTPAIQELRLLSMVYERTTPRYRR